MGLPSQHDVVPLEIAARLVQERAYGPDSSWRPTEQVKTASLTQWRRPCIHVRGQLHSPVGGRRVRVDAVEIATEALTRASAAPQQRQRTGRQEGA
jgi:hypothetical protein